VAYYDRAWNKGDMGTTPAFGAHTVPRILGKPYPIGYGIHDGEHG
jgi:hypothetical protein